MRPCSAVSRSNELALALHGTHSGQLETVNGMLARAPLAGGSPRELLADVRWADWDADGALAVVHPFEGHSRLEYPVGNVLYQSGGWISNIRFSPQGQPHRFHGSSRSLGQSWNRRVVDLSGTCSNSHRRVGIRERIGVAARWQGNLVYCGSEKGNDLNLMAVNLSGRFDRCWISRWADHFAGHRGGWPRSGRAQIQAAGDGIHALPGRKEDIDLSWHDWNSAHDISADGQICPVRRCQSRPPAPTTRSYFATLMAHCPSGWEKAAPAAFPDGKWAISVSTSERAANHVASHRRRSSRARFNVTGLQHIHNGWARFLPDGQRLAVNGDEDGHAASAMS